jgi:tRNA nucleotidyltransferase (CCA-adding enzyme)
LLKKFMKGIGVYGAEIKIGGFSGYLCELLILRYMTFLSTLEAFAKCKQKIIIDLENHYRNRENEINLLFDEPLVLVDPVDRARNVASAVQKTKLYSFVAAAQAFLHHPKVVFFFPPEAVAMGRKEMAHKLKSRGLALVFVVFEKTQTVPDVLWGQLYKSQRSLQKLLKLNHFSVLRDTAWSDEKNLCMFIFEVEDKHVSQAMRHIGPPLDKEEEGRKFVSKYLDNQGVVSGPYIEGDRWFVLLKRKFFRAEDLLEAKLRNGGKDSGVANGITNDLKKGFKILVNEDIVKVYEQSKEFAVFLTDFLNAKPKWLGSQRA